MEKKRILVGEDERNILKMTAKRLQHEGYDVIGVTDGEAVVEQASAGLPIHLILLDIKLPGLNGYDVCRVLKRQATTADIPVIVFSASEGQMQRMAERCLEVGAADWIKKPFHTKDLMAKIHQALREEGGGANG